MPKRDEPKNSKSSRGGARTYTWPPTGEQFVSVTTALSVINKPALVNWAAKEVAQFALDNLDQIRTIASKDQEAALDMMKRSPYRKKTKAADLGSSVHRAVEALVLEQPFPEWELDVAPFMWQFEQFVKDVAPSFEMAEASVYSREHQYAGTLDSIAVVNGRRLVIDVKTGKGVYPEFALQLSGYRNAEFIGAPGGEEVPMPATDGAAVLHLRPEGYDLIEVRTDADVYFAFLSALELYRWQQSSKDSVGASLAAGKVKVPA